MVSRSHAIFTAALVLLLSPRSSGGDAPRVLLLGGAGESPPGLGPSDWVRVFLDLPFQGKEEVVDGGLAGGTVKQGREALEKLLAVKPSAIVLDFGLGDALRSTPEEFRRAYEGLLDEVGRMSPESRLVLVTATPVDDRHRLAKEERFRGAGGIGEILRKGFVEPVREIAAARKLSLADHFALFEEAVRSGEKIEDLVQAETGLPTARGNLLAGRSIGLSVLFVLGRRDRLPSTKEVLGGEGESPVLPPPPAELGPLLAVWEKDLEPLWLERMRDEDPDVRFGALRRLFEVRSIPKGFLEALLSFLERPQGGAEQEVGNILTALVQGEKATKEEAMAALLTMIRKAGPGSLPSIRAFPILDRVASIDLKGPLPPGARVPSPVPPGARAPAAAVEVRFADEDLALFEGSLSSREQGIRAAAAHLLVLSGEPGLRKLLAAMGKLPENLALENLDRLWGWRLAADAPFKGFLIGAARGDPREGVRLFSRSLVLQLNAREIPLDFLRELFAGETGSVQVRAAQLLAERGDEGLEVLVQGLRAAEEDRVQLSRTALLYLGLYSSSDAAARKAFAALDEHFTPERQKEFLICLNAVLQKASPPLACLPEPSGRRIISGAGRKGIPLRSQRLSDLGLKTSGRPAIGGEVPVGPWPAESNIPQVDRLKDFLPRLERSLREGSDEEKEAAESLLSQIWGTAGQILDAASKRPPGIPAPLAGRLEKEAGESLKKDDAGGFLRKAHQAVVAGANESALNSFARKLAVSARDDLRDPLLAERWAREAISRGGRKPAYLDTLAAALAAQGKFREALDLEVEAIQGLAADVNQAPYVARAILYLSGKPYREPEKKQG